MSQAEGECDGQELRDWSLTSICSSSSTFCSPLSSCCRSLARIIMVVVTGEKDKRCRVNLPMNRVCVFKI